MSTLKAFMLTYLSWFSKFIMIDGIIIDDTIEDLKKSKCYAGKC